MNNALNVGQNFNKTFLVLVYDQLRLPSYNAL